MTGGLLQSKRGWLVAALVGALLGAVAWPWVAPRVVSRSISMTVELRGEGPLALRWHHNRGSNGTWIDFDDPILKVTRQENGWRQWALGQWLPSYGIARLALEPSEGASAAASDARIMTRLFGLKLPTRTLTGEAENGTVQFGPLAPAWRDVLIRGVLGSAAIGALVGLALLAVTRCIPWLETRSRDGAAAFDVPEAKGTANLKRWLDAVTVVVCVAAPLFMCLWSPMLMVADSTAYLWFAELLRQLGTIEHFDGWRMPAYGFFVTPFISLFTDFARPVGVAQCVMGAISSLLVFDMLRGRARSPWSHIAAMLVAMDPILLGWQRVVMGESMSALTITFAGWVFLKAAKPGGRAAQGEEAKTVLRGLLLGLVLGLVCGWACLIRGNNQVVPAVLVMGLAWCGIAWKRREILAAAAPTIVLTGLMLLPLCVLNAKNYDRFKPAVGRDFTRALFSWENGTTDWNQCGTLSFEEFKELRTMLREGARTDWDVLEWLAKTSTVPVPEGASPWLAMDVRSGAMVDEAVARQGPKVLKRQVQSAAGLLGIPVTEPAYALNGTWAIFAQLRGEPNPRTTTNFDFVMEKFPPYMQKVIGRSVHDISWTQGHPAAKVFGVWFDSWRWVRAVLGALFVGALARLIVLRQWAFAALGLVVLANIVGVPVLTYAAEYRYAAPFYPLVVVVIVFGLFTPGGPTCEKGRNQADPDL